MNLEQKQFWHAFNKGYLEEALKAFMALEKADQLELFEALFQHSANSRTPFLISVLRRKLLDDQGFDDFYNAWFPAKDSCQPVSKGGQTYQQHFPVTTRVINGTKIDDQKEILSLGITWVKSDEEKQGLLDYLARAQQGDDDSNEQRHEKIKESADGELIGLFLVRTDDNLGSPY